jgi:hypothetical protein
MIKVVPQKGRKRIPHFVGMQARQLRRIRSVRRYQMLNLLDNVRVNE